MRYKLPVLLQTHWKYVQSCHGPVGPKERVKGESIGFEHVCDTSGNSVHM